MSILASLGPWNWMILAATLLVLEMLAPGIFLMWFGFAAALTGTGSRCCRWLNGYLGPVVLFNDVDDLDRSFCGCVFISPIGHR